MHESLDAKTCAAVRFAFQPYVDAVLRMVVGHEALVRGTGGESADAVLRGVSQAQRHAFDLHCRARALEQAKELGLDRTGHQLNINVLASVIGERGEFLLQTVEAAERLGFPCHSLVLEITEVEFLQNPARLRAVLRDLHDIGFRTAIDDFGAGWSNLVLLAEMQPDLVKLDRALIRDIDTDARRRDLVRRIRQACDDLGCGIVAEGIETVAESHALVDLGIHLQQGFLFAQPCLGGLQLSVDFPAPRNPLPA